MNAALQSSMVAHENFPKLDIKRLEKAKKNHRNNKVATAQPVCSHPNVF